MIKAQEIRLYSPDCFSPGGVRVGRAQDYNHLWVCDPNQTHSLVSLNFSYDIITLRIQRKACQVGR